ncbi:MAG: AAA family ATPase [Marinilabiliaceae bacterium]
MHFKKNDRICDYTVSFPLKQGANTETYRIKDAQGQTLFLKLIDITHMEAWRRDVSGNIIEVEVAKKQNCHNLCKFIDSGTLTFDGFPYAWLATEFISGETLAQHIARGETVSVYEIKEIAKGVLTALASLHSLPTPIFHNNVTLQNILLNLTGGLGDLKLIGLGHAHPPSKLGNARTDGINLDILAPERFFGVCSAQTDIYSVGVMMYQLLYGVSPWSYDTSAVHINKSLEDILAERKRTLNFPLDGIFELDDSLISTINKALSFSASDRFQTAEEFIKAIDDEIEVKKVDKGNRDLPARELPKEGKGFAAIAGMDELKRILQEEVIEPLRNSEEYRRYRVSIPNGMLLYGPPGCGKTFFAKHFAEEVGFNFICATPASLKSRYVNATQENIAKMFKEAEKKAPTVIFIDEINELVPNRNGAEIHEMSRSAVNEMLAQMDRTGEKGIFVIGATNYPDMIDPAILRAGRFDKKFYIGLPDTEARKALFNLSLQRRPCDFGLDYDELAMLTEGYVSADIELIVNEAAGCALRRHTRISMELLKAAITETRPSLSVEERQKYELIRAKMNR